MAEITNLPIWKKNATAFERLSELALMAKEKPTRFDKFALVYQEQMPNGNVKFHYMDFNTADIFQTMGLFEAGKIKCWEESAK